MRIVVAGAVAVVAVTGLSVSASARADGAVARYKARVNGVCIRTTPKLVKAERAIKRASTRAASIAALDRYVTIGLGQNTTILRLPVPLGARTEMAPFLRLTHQGDALIVRLVRALKAGNQALYIRLAARVDALGRTYDRVADARGLRRCGSDQTRALSRA